MGTSTVSDILKKKDSYLDQFETNSDCQKNRFENSCKFDQSTWEWFKKARCHNYPLSGPIIQAKALKFDTTLGLTDFKASNGWFDLVYIHLIQKL